MKAKCMNDRNKKARQIYNLYYVAKRREKNQPWRSLVIYTSQLQPSVIKAIYAQIHALQYKCNGSKRACMESQEDLNS